MNNSYRILKLRSGEELITRIKGEKKDKLVIERPMVFKSSTLTDPHGRAKEVTVLKNWLSYAGQEEASIPKDFIASFLEPDNDVLKLYDYEKKKDDFMRSQVNKKNRIINNYPVDKNTKNINNFDKSSDDEENFKGKESIENLINFFNQLGDKKERSFMDKIMEDIESLDDEELNELKNQAYQDKKSQDDFVNYITMTLFLPPDALMSFVEGGLLDEEDVRELIDGLKGRVNEDEIQKGLFDYLENRNPDEYGNDFRDWSPHPKDYFKDHNDH